MKSWLYLPSLLEVLRKNPTGLLTLIDLHPRIRRRPMAHDLVVATCGPELAAPREPEELLAKGIVYTRDPYRLVSLPLVKMYNHGIHQEATELYDALKDSPGVEEVILEKLDGTMIQVFEYEGKVLFATRGAGEGSDLPPEHMDYTKEARAIAMEVCPAILDSEVVEGKTLIFELIHPGNRIITDYGDRRELVLHGIFYRETCTYAPHSEVDRFAHRVGVSSCESYPFGDLEQNLKSIEGRAHTPEGFVVCLEKDHEVIHRVKAKTSTYVDLHALKYNCTLKQVSILLWNTPRWTLNDEEAFTTYLKDVGLAGEEEILGMYMTYHAQYITWLEGIRRTCKVVWDTVLAYTEQHADTSKDNDYYGAFARTFQQSEEGRRILPLMMQLLRGKDVTLCDVARRYPIFKGFHTHWTVRDDSPGHTLH